MSGNGFHGQMSDKFRSAVFIILSGGFQDAYTYCCRGGVFANAQTGNIVLMSAALFRGDWEAVVKYLVPVLSFLLGIAGGRAGSRTLPQTGEDTLAADSPHRGNTAAVHRGISP